MTGLVRKATFLAVLGLLMTAAVALAGVPDPAHCTVPEWIDVVGNLSGTVDPYGQFTVTVADVADNPLEGVLVTVTITCSDATICAPTPTIAGQTNTCVSAGVKTVEAYTDADGIATFDIAGASNNTGALATGCGYDGATIYAQTAILLGTATVTTFDENGAATNPGVEITDLTAWLQDFGAYQASLITYKGRSDFSHANAIDIVDLTKWLILFGLGNSANGCGGSYCP